MEAHRQSFGEEICEIMRTFSRSDTELPLLDTVSYPVELHMNRFCLFRCKGVGR